MAEISDEAVQIEVIYARTGTTTPPGGQQAGSPATLVRVTHLPTLTMAQCGIHRSQHRNLQTAKEMLLWALS